ncbi:MAG: hypothetical protein KBS55_02260 [Bacteroidales bacterium]|nr:hypothetical protein [Candidatus Cryptobacteroides aphodequi]
MLEALNDNIAKLVSLYENERQRANNLASDLVREREANRSNQAKIAELKHEIDNLNLLGAFGSADTAEAKKRINELIKSIDSCIALLEK